MWLRKTKQQHLEHQEEEEIKILSLDCMLVLSDYLSNIHLTICYILPVGVSPHAHFPAMPWQEYHLKTSAMPEIWSVLWKGQKCVKQSGLSI
jgi:hypothetical protein